VASTLFLNIAGEIEPYTAVDGKVLDEVRKVVHEPSKSENHNTCTHIEQIVLFC
jgi:hypothetical protein